MLKFQEVAERLARTLRRGLTAFLAVLAQMNPASEVERWEPFFQKPAAVSSELSELAIEARSKDIQSRSVSS